MKRFIAILIAALVLFCAAFAEADPVSSPVAPTVVIVPEETIAVQEDVVLPENFAIVVIEEEKFTPAVVELHEEIQALVTEGKSIVEMYSEEEKQAIMEVLPELPEEFDLNKLQVSEYVPMEAFGYTEEIGEISVQFEVPSEYTEDDIVIAMLGQIALGETEADEENVISWRPLPTKVVEGKLQVTFDEEAMKVLETQEAVLVILKEFE